MGAMSVPARDLTLVDEALLLGAGVALISERTGRPLEAWQQRIVDRTMVAFLTSIASEDR